MYILKLSGDDRIVPGKLKLLILFLVLSNIFTTFAGAMDTISNSYIGINVDPSYFVFNMGTSSSYSPASANLLYRYTDGHATSHIVVKVNNKAYDLENLTYCPVIGTVTVSGTKFISGTKKVAGLVNVNVQWLFVNNPATGTPTDTAMIKLTLQNISSVTVNVAARLVLDTMVITNDGTNISIDNGFSVIMQNTAWYKTLGNIPPNWWDFDVNPTTGTPTLVGRGYIYNNATGTAATQPDMMEVANYVDVSSTAQWTVAPSGSDMAADKDSAVVLWWCNGDETSSGFSLAPTDSVTFITYYGINEEQMLTSPTSTPTSTITETESFTPTKTVTLTASSTPTWTLSSTASPTLTQTPTWTSSFTETVTQTKTFTVTGTPTFTVTGTFTATQTATVTFSATQTSTDTPFVTATVSPTVTSTDTPTFTSTITASFTCSITGTPSYTASPTATLTTTITATATDTATRTAFCFEVLGVFPNPFKDETGIVYKVCKDADIDAVIYTVSGEVVVKIHQKASQGWNKLYWDRKNNAGKTAANGIFIYSIEASSEGEKQKLWGKAAAI